MARPRTAVGPLRRGAALLLSTIALAALAVSPAVAGSPQGQFVLRCMYSHTLMDDPIVFPGQPGASHSHDFFGNETANASSTLDSMLSGETTCRVPSDTAGYWSPTAYLNLVPIRPTVMRIYYLGSPGVEAFPPGLELVGGNRDATSGAENPHVRWSCGETKDVKTPRGSIPYDCSFWADRYRFVDGLIAIVDMPSCWDGVGLEPGNVTYPVGGRCPGAFPHVLPRLSERVHYGIIDPTNPDGSMALTLSSGEYWTYHADFWNTWQQPRLDQLVDECLVARVHCGSVDASDALDWARQFGTTRYDLAYATATSGSGVYVAGFTNFALTGQHYHRRYDAFVSKYDVDGDILWSRQFGSSGTDQALALAADDGGVTVVGSTDGRIVKEESAGGVDAFVARFGSAGGLRWIHQLGTRAEDRATAVAIGTDGTFIAGTTGGTLGDRRGGGPTDAFVARVDASSGGIAWVRQFGGGRADEANGIAVREGRAYVVGSTTGPIGEADLAGNSDGLVAAFRTNGAPMWQRAIATDGVDRLTAVVARARGLFISGSTGGALEGQAPSGGLDAFVGKRDLGGAEVWFRQFGSPTDDEAVAIGADAKGLYVAGSTSDALPDGTALGEWDGFVRKYLPNGTQLWTRQLGTTDYDRVYGLSVERTGLYLAGTTHGAFEGELNAGDRDAFLLRIAFS